MQTDLELAWHKATPNERQAFIEFFADDIRELLPAYDDRDNPDDLITYEPDVGDDEEKDPVDLPCIVDPQESLEIGDDDDEDFHAAARGVERRAGGKRVTAAPSKDDLQRMTQEFLSRGGQITKVRPGSSGLQPPPKRVAAWRKIAGKGA